MKGMPLLWLLSSLLPCFAAPLAVPLRIDDVSEHDVWLSHEAPVYLVNNGREVNTLLSRIRIALFREAATTSLKPLVILDYQSRVKRPYHHNMRNDVDLTLRLYRINKGVEEQVLEQRIWGITRECRLDPPGKIFTFVPGFELNGPYRDLPLTQLVRAELEIEHQIRSMKTCPFKPDWEVPPTPG